MTPRKNVTETPPSADEIDRLEDPPPTAHRSTTDQIREMESEGQAQEPSANDGEPGPAPAERPRGDGDA